MKICKKIGEYVLYVVIIYFCLLFITFLLYLSCFEEGRGEMECGGSIMQKVVIYPINLIIK